VPDRAGYIRCTHWGDHSAYPAVTPGSLRVTMFQWIGEPRCSEGAYNFGQDQKYGGVLESFLLSAY